MTDSGRYTPSEAAQREHDKLVGQAKARGPKDLRRLAAEKSMLERVENYAALIVMGERKEPVHLALRDGEEIFGISLYPAKENPLHLNGKPWVLGELNAIAAGLENEGVPAALSAADEIRSVIKRIGEQGEQSRAELKGRKARLMELYEAMSDRLEKHLGKDVGESGEFYCLISQIPDTDYSMQPFHETLIDVAMDVGYAMGEAGESCQTDSREVNAFIHERCGEFEQEFEASTDPDKDYLLMAEEAATKIIQEMRDEKMIGVDDAKAGKAETET